MIEENGHSQFLVELLNDKRILEFFLEVIDSNIEFVSDIKITFEEQADTIEAKGRIDIFLTDGTNALLIENKINANDQPKQLERYNDWATDSNLNFELYYLSPYGSNPSAEGLGKLKNDQIKIISYSEHIRDWLKKCLNEDDQKQNAIEDYLSRWDKYFVNDWSNEDNQLYDFFKAVSLINLTNFELEYVDEPLNKSHIPHIVKGSFHLNFAHQGKDIKLIYDKNENDIFVRMNADDFEASVLKQDGWEKSGQFYDYVIYNIESITEEKFPFTVTINNFIDNINKAFRHII